MTVNVLRRSSPADSPDAGLAIGDPDGAIFVCPACSRPVASGAGRCPGCRARFVFDVPVRRAGLLVSIGLASGLLIGGGGVAIAALTRPAPATDTPIPTAPVVSPTTTPVDPGNGAGPGTPAVPAVPPAAIAALRGTTTINGRIVEIGIPLAATMASDSTDASLIARHLRRLSVEVGAAETLVAGLATWDEAAPFADELGAFYSTLLTRVRTGLDASVRDRAAYRATATEVLAILEALPALEATGQGLAATAASAAR